MNPDEVGAKETTEVTKQHGVWRPELLAVELPFRMKNPLDKTENEKKVLALLGGQKTLDKSVFHDKSSFADVQTEGEDGGSSLPGIKMWLQPENPISHSIVDSTRIPERTPIILRLKRSRKTKVIHSAKVVGIVDAFHGFENLSDFIFRPGPLREEKVPENPGLAESLQDRLPAAMAVTNGTKVANPYSIRKNLYIPPAYFAQSVPYNSFDFADHLKSSKSSSSSAARVDADAVDGLAPSTTSLVELTLDNMTKPLPKKPEGVEELEPEEAALVVELEGIFHHQPCWMKESLLAKFPPEKEKEVMRCVTFVAYKVKNGPFGTLLIHFGYDPRQDRASSKYQTIMYRLDKQWNRVLEQFSSITGVAVSGIPLRGFNRVQLCDVRDQEVRDLCKSNVQARYDPKFGWFSDLGQNKIRSRLYKLIEGALQELDSAKILSPATIEGNAPPFDPEAWEIGDAPDEPQTPVKRRRRNIDDDGFQNHGLENGETNLLDSAPTSQDALEMYDAYAIPGESDEFNHKAGESEEDFAPMEGDDDDDDDDDNDDEDDYE